VQKAGLKNVLVTNGYLEAAPLKELLPYIDALNIDLKAFNNDFYRTVCGGSLNEVLRTVEIAAAKCHVEITTLLVPTLNDDCREIKELAKWLKVIDENIPLHFSRYFPQYKMPLPPTPLETLNQAAQIAREELKYVYLGNIGSVNTYCPDFSFLLVDRASFASFLTPENKCPNCGAELKNFVTT
jgi:pyruvate formate lyase activating enzyme